MIEYYQSVKIVNYLFLLSYAQFNVDVFNQIKLLKNNICVQKTCCFCY